MPDSSDRITQVRKIVTILALVYLVGAVGVTVLGSPDFRDTVVQYWASLFPDKDITVDQDLRYAGENNHVSTGDLYRSASASAKPLPVVVLLHGGSWCKGSDKDLSEVSLARLFAKHGYAAFNINYRMTADGGFPLDIVDVHNALSFLVANAGKYNIDPARVFVLGTSSGASAALVAAYTTVKNEFPADGIFKDHACSVRAVASVSGPTDFTNLSENPYLREYLHSKDVQPPLDALKAASPVSYVATAVPTICVHGTEDVNVPNENSVNLVKMLTKLHVPAALVNVEGVGHFMGTVSRDQALEHVFRFFHEHDPGQ